MSLRESQISESLLKVGVEQKCLPHLMNKLAHGELLDSMKNEYANVQPSERKYENGFIQEKYLYPDGSVKILKISAGTFAGKISGGTYNSGSYWYTWNNARVFGSWGFVIMSFRASFEGAKGAGIIHSVSNGSVTTAGGTFKNKSLKINRAKATSNAAARATLSIYWNGYQGAAASDVRLYLYVLYNGNPYAKISTLA